MESNIKGFVAAGHEMASELKAECGAVDMRNVAKLLSDLATQLEVQLVRANALAAENALARKAVQAFCDVVGDNTEVICEEVGRDGVLVILEAMKATGNMPVTDAFLAEIERKAIRKFINSIEHILRDKLSPYDTEEMLEAMRIFLEITDVRVERLHDMSEADAKAEGATPATYKITPSEAVYRVGFGDIWRSIYGQDNWLSNPLVWVIEFKRIQE
ncbi:hypothetical protein [Escherichia coli]|uniref:hypothetical protein n=1 Tax=Escherichia coli TaxID=562 RepID=UPI001D14D616|nr:hypothetical protein [Escherichia coli]EFN7575020.1 hypothetical protein [Escherichia coli]